MSQPQIPMLYVKRLTNDLNLITKPEAFDILPHMQSLLRINSSELCWTLPGFSFLPASAVLTAARMKTSARRAAVNIRRCCCCCCILGINKREEKRLVRLQNVGPHLKRCYSIFGKLANYCSLSRNLPENRGS